MAAAPPPPGLQQPGPSPPAPGQQKGQRSLRRRQGQRADELAFGIWVSQFLAIQKWKSFPFNHETPWNHRIRVPILRQPHDSFHFELQADQLAASQVQCLHGCGAIIWQEARRYQRRCLKVVRGSHPKNSTSLADWICFLAHKISSTLLSKWCLFKLSPEVANHTLRYWYTHPFWRPHSHCTYHEAWEEGQQTCGLTSARWTAKSTWKPCKSLCIRWYRWNRLEFRII